MQDLGLVAGTSESSGSLYQMSSTTGANPRPIQPEPASGEMATENWTCWPFPAGHLGQSGPGPHRKWALHLPNRSRQTGMEWIPVCPDFSGRQKPVCPQQKQVAPAAIGPTRVFWGWQFMSLSSGDTPKFLILWQVSEGLCGHLWCYKNIWEEKPQDPTVLTWADGCLQKVTML